jgi:hypothetical protein
MPADGLLGNDIVLGRGAVLNYQNQDTKQNSTIYTNLIREVTPPYRVACPLKKPLVSSQGMSTQMSSM